MKNTQSGFSLIEAMIAILLMTISALGVTSIFAFAVSYNKNNSNRTQAMVVAQKKVEELRTAIFSTAFTDASLNAVTLTTQTITDVNGKRYTQTLSIDDDPFAIGNQTNAATKIKEITVTVTPAGANTWVTAAQTRIVTRRTRSN
jgi:prepilin-type N-terminal cleavage/methylation domain-containing protein